MRNALLLLSLLLVLEPAFSQNTVEVRDIQWLDPFTDTVGGTHPALHMINGSYDRSAVIPSYFELIPLPAGISDCNASITNTVFVPLLSAENELLSGQSIDTALQLTGRVEASGNSKFLSFTLLPVRKNPATGQLEKLVRFNFQLLPSKGNLKSGNINASVYASHSVLSSGKWLKIKIQNSGIYTFSYGKLKDLGFSNPANVRIFGNGGRMVPISNSTARDDDLQEVPVWQQKGQDGQFGPGDNLFFYAEGVLNWDYNAQKKLFLHSLNGFSDYAYYFLTEDLGPPAQVLVQAPALLTPDHNVTTFNDYAAHELDLENLIRSGSQWFGESFNSTTQYDFTFSFPGLSLSDSVTIYANLAARYGSSTSFTLQLNNQFLTQLVLPGVPVYSSTDDYASQGIASGSAMVDRSQLDVGITYNKSDLPSALGWLDFIDLNVKRSLAFAGGQMAFRCVQNTGPGKVGQFIIGNTVAGLQVWDVTDQHAPVSVTLNANAQNSAFIAATDQLREYVAFDPAADLPVPLTQGDDVGWLSENQDLHSLSSVDMVIVTHPKFLEQANEVANLHRQHDGLSVVVATTDQVYNEFSSGAHDVAAIRDFMKMLYDRGKAGGKLPSYLLLFGDGSYDNKRNLQNNTNYILTYESPNSLNQSNSFVTDDFYGLLDDNEGGYGGLLDIGIGRFPVKDTLEARAMITKTSWYLDPANRADWRNMICFIADDEDANIHMQQADELATYISSNYPAYAVQKIYLDAYQQITTASGPTYPDVNKAIQQRINQGSLIVNYTGHGNEIGLAQEKVFQDDEIRNLDNGNLLPVFVTATCEFSRFDDLLQTSVNSYGDATSAGEHLLLNPNGGAIALFSTTRLVYSGPNFALNEQFYRFVFQHDSLGNRYRLGDIIRLSKNATGSGINKLNFTLLGDPALIPAYPDLRVQTDSINHIALNAFNDTLKAYDKVTVSGYVQSSDSTDDNGFNGTLYPIVYDKLNTVTTLNNDGDGPMTFTTYNSILFKGRVSVAAGRFVFSYIVPRDINYAIGPAKILYYANSAGTDAHGYLQGLLTGGISPSESSDNQGPLVRLYMNDTTFVNGGMTDENPVMLAYLTDESGINTTGSGIGHDITLSLDGGDKLFLDDYFESDMDSYTRGQVKYPLSSLATGQHQLTFKVWDIYNNSSEAALDFVVVGSDHLVLRDLINYPNPFTSETWFRFNHNQPGEELDVRIDIFSLTGQAEKVIQTRIQTDGFETEPIYWDGTDHNGQALARGIYIYRVQVTTPAGETAVKSGKLMLLR